MLSVINTILHIYFFLCLKVIVSYYFFHNTVFLIAMPHVIHYMLFVISGS